jgi:hypothetical protein
VIAEDVHEVSVGDIAAKVADNDAVLGGVVDRTEILFNSCLDEGRTSSVDSRRLRGRISHHLHPPSIPETRSSSG